MVYVLREKGTNYCKIGKADDVTSRVATLQTGNPRQLEVIAVLPGNETAEREMHRKYWHYRVPSGGEEWFDIPPEIIDRITLGDMANGNFTQNQCSIGGTSPADVRPLRWGQQDTVTHQGADVPGRQSGLDNPRDKSIQPPMR